MEKKKIYIVVKGHDNNFYSISKIFSNKEDAEKYIDYMQFYTSELLWIIESDIEDKYIQEDKGIPLVNAYINADNRVFRVNIADYSYSNKEQRFSNLFTFYLERNENENLQDFLIRAKQIAIKKQIEYMKNK